MTTEKTKKIPLFWRVIIIIAAGFIGLLLLLWAIPLNSGPVLPNPDFISVYSNGSATQLTCNSGGLNDSYTERYNGIVNTFNKSNKVSVLRSVFSNNWSGVRLATVDEEDAANDETLTEQEVVQEMGSNTYMLVYTYNSVQTVKVRGVEFKFDRAKILLNDTQGEVGGYTIILWNQADFAPSGQPPYDENLRIRPIFAKGVNSKIYNHISDLLED